jgi:hypothetical protein
VSAATDPTATPRRRGGAPGSRRRRALIAAVVAVVALVGATLLGGAPAEDGPPLDPRSAAPDGLRGVLDLATEFSHQVDISGDLPSDTSTRLFVVRDRLGSEGRERMRSWVASGGHLVVADPASPLHDLEVGGEPVTDLIGPSRRAPDCALAGLAGVETVRHAAWRSYRVPDDGTGCFPGADGEAWLVARSVGHGEVVALGSVEPLLNRSLDRDDNAVLAAALLFPAERGALVILPPDPAELGEGLRPDEVASPQEAVSDLLPAGLPGALVLLGLATLVLLLALGRRLGRPVEERLPPTLPSAELTRSVGDLLQRAGSRQGAAERLRAGARSEVARVLGVDAAAHQALVDQATARLPLSGEVARVGLLDQPVADDEDLVEVARATAEIRDLLTRVS